MTPPGPWLQVGPGWFVWLAGRRWGLSVAVTRAFGLVVSVTKYWDDGFGWQRPYAYSIPWTREG